MKYRLIIAVILIVALFSGCASTASTENASAVNPSPSLTDEQLEVLGISQDEFNGLSEEQKAEMQAILDEMSAQEDMPEPTKSTEAPTTAPTEDPRASIDPEADVQKYLQYLPPLPSGDKEYNYEWSDRLDRISYYLITIDPASDTEIYDFMYSLEMEYGFMSGGKEQWDETTNTSVYDYSTDELLIYVDVTPNDDGTVKTTIWISYNPFI